jgi:hypothetical protein
MSRIASRFRGVKGEYNVATFYFGETTAVWRVESLAVNSAVYLPPL